ncbi:DNA topoisomerase [Lithospermum erythrorhizon]|uniref:DNA topoisomerase I n=1 Tax=Lithospermum erythrorhizon TaxID=34254 RepID=A0AAV3R928_LITER
MAVNACSNRNLMEDYEHHQPVVFKRSSTTSRQSQSNTESYKSSSQKPDGQPGRQASDVCSANGGSASGLNGTTISSSKASSEKSPLPGMRTSASSSEVPLSRSPSPTVTSPMSDHGNRMSPGLAGTIVKEEKSSAEPSKTANGDSDSEDEVPLSMRTKSRSVNSSKTPQGSNSTSRLSAPKQEESDDDKPLSNFKRATNGASSSNYSDSEDEKPLAKRRQQNGLAPTKKSSVGSDKRPSTDSKSSVQSLIKRPKLSNASTSRNLKPASVKAEPKVVEDNDHIPVSQRIKLSGSSTSVGKKYSKGTSSVKKVDKKSKKIEKTSKYEPSSSGGQKWTTLVHNGVIFPPPYQPHGVKMLYKGKPVDLTPGQEEVATMYAVMLDTDYISKPQFRENFFNDWKKILGKNHVIQNLEDCDFTPMYEWHQAEKEKKKQRSSDEKKAINEEKMKLEEKYKWAIVDGVKEKVGSFRVEPPGLFRGRGEHPKVGKLKKRIRPSDITINIGKGAPIPECPVPGERWKEVRNDNTVTWLAYWMDPINSKEFKYVFLAPSSALKGQSDKEKYEKARKLTDHIDKIREAYTKNFTSKDATKQQIAVATYLIDKLALRAGNEKDDDEADTVGCCTLKVENVEPVPPNTLEFDFLGKDSIRYHNVVEVELPVFEAIQKFRKGKKGGDNLFDMLDTSKLNAHLKELVPGLTAKVFRTYNASKTLDDLLSAETNVGDVAENIVVYQHANKEVAIICNHQRTVSKSHDQQMERLDEKIKELNNVLEELEVDLDRAKKGKPPLKGTDGKTKRNLAPEALEKKIAQTHLRIEKMERDKSTKEDLKTVALGTSKINYLDPRITVAWCKRHEVPMEKIFNKSLLAKFSWAMDVEPSFRF